MVDMIRSSFFNYPLFKAGVILLFILSCFFIPSFAGAAEGKDPVYQDLKDGLYAGIQTAQGDILVELYYKRVPMTVINFAGLAQGKMKTTKRAGKKFYDGLVFHRVIPDFMIQGGCPDGTGRGGPGYKFADEFDPSLIHDGPGVLSMANSGPNTNGSQFFITHKATPWLDFKHTVFGRVVKGQDVVNLIEAGDELISVQIIPIGKEAKAFKTDQASFDSIRNRQKSALADQIKKDLAAFEEKMTKKHPDAVKTESGLMYIPIKAGQGPKVTSGARVKVHYTGVLEDGKKFDSSRDRGRPIQFNLGKKEVIKGWDIGIAGMKKGEMRRLLIPYPLAYGEKGYPGVIPPKATLIFDVELMDFQ